MELSPFPAPDGDFQFCHHVIIVSKPLHIAKRIFFLDVERSVLSGRDVTRVRHGAMGVASWLAGSSLAFRLTFEL